MNKLTDKEIKHAYENPQWLKDNYPKAFEEAYIKVPLSVITLIDSDKKLGERVRSIAKNY